MSQKLIQLEQIAITGSAQCLADYVDDLRHKNNYLTPKVIFTSTSQNSQNILIGDKDISSTLFAIEIAPGEIFELNCTDTRGSDEEFNLHDIYILGTAADVLNVGILVRKP